VTNGTDEDGFYYSPVFLSRDRIAYVKAWGEEQGIWLSDLAKPHQRLLTQKMWVRDLVASPDGSRMAFIGGPEKETSSLWLIHADGTGLRKLAPAWGWLSYSFDSTRIMVGDSVPRFFSIRVASTSPQVPMVSEKRSVLPLFHEQLNGQNEVRVQNPNNFSVVVGVRSGLRGKDFEVPANGTASVYVPDGPYDVYFVYSNEPTALFQGDSFTLKGNGVEIQIVKVVGGNYGIRRVK
jgi:hypothetical protein